MNYFIIDLGDTCIDNDYCRGIEHSSCDSDFRCTCATNYFNVNGSCLHYMGTCCLKDSNCGIKNSVCERHHCQCKKNYFFHPFYLECRKKWINYFFFNILNKKAISLCIYFLFFEKITKSINHFLDIKMVWKWPIFRSLTKIKICVIKFNVFTTLIKWNINNFANYTIRITVKLFKYVVNSVRQLDDLLIKNCTEKEVCPIAIRLKNLLLWTIPKKVLQSIRCL